MALSPIPYVIQASGDAADAPEGAIPVAMYGNAESAPVAVADVTGLQEIITDLTSRIEALETPEA